MSTSSSASSVRPSASSAKHVDLVPVARYVWLWGTIVVGIYILIYYAFPSFQLLLDGRLGFSLYDPFVAVAVVIGWFWLGENNVTQWVADIRNSIFHLIAAALVLALLAIVRFWPLLSPLWDYVKKNGDPSLGSLCLGSIALLVLVVVAVVIRLWSTRKETK